jgi:hypothetical protein
MQKSGPTASNPRVSAASFIVPQHERRFYSQADDIGNFPGR